MLTYASEIWTQYPNGATVYDRTGRRIGNVFACNPETGEVIRRVPWGEGRAHPIVALFRLLGTLHLLNPSLSLIRRHGFWLAPLRVERKQWLHIGFGQWGRDRPPLPVLDDRTPEEICGYGDDGLCSH
jgi:hypothetical protein